MIHLTLPQLSAYFDGELSEASTEIVRLHLSQCAECTLRFARMEAQEEILVRLLTHDPGEAFFEFFRNAVALEGDGAPRPWPRAEAGSPDLSASFEGDPGTLIPNVDPPAAHAPSIPPAGSPPRPESPGPPAAVPAGAAKNCGRRAEDQARPPFRSSAVAGWAVAALMTVVTISVAMVTSKPRVSPLPIPRAGGATPGDEGIVPERDGGDGAAIDESAAGGSSLEDGAEAVASDTTSRAGVPEGGGAPGPAKDLDLPVWARAEAIQPPPPPRPAPRAAGTASPAPSPEQERPGTSPQVSDGPSRETLIAQDFARAKQLSLAAAGSMTARSFEEAAAAWEALLPRLSGEPEREATAWRETAQARFQAWSADPTSARRDGAIHAARAYLLYAPPGPDRDQAWTWLARLKQAEGANPR